VWRANARAGARWLVSRSACSLIARAVDAWRDTGGRYDPTVLAALEAAGYDRSFDDVAPIAPASAHAQTSPWRTPTLDARTPSRRRCRGAATSSSTTWWGRCDCHAVSRSTSVASARAR